MRFLALLACLCVAFLALPSTARASDVVQSWAQNYQTTGTGGESPNIFTVDAKGFIYIASSLPLPQLEANYWIIRKINSLGQFQWSQTFLATGAPQGMAADATGDLYITSFEAPEGSSQAALTIKLLSNGDLDWAEEFPGGNGQSVHIDSAGNCYVGGTWLHSGLYELLLLEYNPNGELANNFERSEISVSSTFFMPNGSLVASGSMPSASNPLLEVISNTGAYLYNYDAADTPSDTFNFVVTCDPSSNLYIASHDAHSNPNTDSFSISCFGPTGTPLWASIGDSGAPQQISASDSNHAYVHVYTGNSTYVDEGFEAGGNKFMSVQSQPELFAADGSKGLVIVTEASTAYTYSEINRDLQTLWTQTYSGTKPEGSFGLSVINSTVYGLNQTFINSYFGTNFIKFVQGVGVTSVTPSKASVQGGQSVNLTLQLNDVTAAGGLAAYWVSNSSALGLPSSTLIPAGKSVLTVTALTQPVDVSTPVTIIAEVNGGDRTATVTLTPAVLSTATFPGGAAASVKGGQTITGTIQLSGPTALLSHAVTLSSNSAKATVPASVNVLAGASTATFVVNTTTVTASTPVVITAKLAGVTVTAKLTVTP